MKLTRVLLSLLVLIILFSFIVTLVHQTKITSFSGFNSATINPLTISTPLSLRAAFFDSISPLNQSTRLEVYNFVKANPGVHFRGICSGLGISIGVAQYHLGVLTKTGLISFFQDERYKRYFNSKSFGMKQKQVISVLRHKTAGKILWILSEKRSIAHNDLASQLEISSQALSWQMRRLRKMDIVDSVTESMKVNYSINEENAMMIKCCIDAIPARKI